MKRKLVGTLLVAAFAVLAVPSSAFAAFDLTGTVYDDVNGNGSKAVTEPGLSGVRMYLDGTGGQPVDDMYQIGETTVNTLSGGGYTFTALAAGTYTVREDFTTLPLGYASQCLRPGGTSATCEISVTGNNSTKSGNDFSDYQPTSVTGTEFIDANANGTQDGGETTAVGGVTIYQDWDHSNTLTAGEPTGTSDGTGAWSLSAKPGSSTASSASEIREVQPSGYQCSAPGTIGDFTTCEFSHTFTSGGSAVSGDKFGNYQPVTISGTKFEDLNANGVQDGAEGALSGVVIYLDLNNDGVRQTSGQSAEPSTTTAATTGAWSFSGLKPGSYHVREVPPTGYECSTPGTIGTPLSCQFNPTLTSGQSSTGNTFGNFKRVSISGTKFLDSNADGIKQNGEGGLTGVTIYLDLDNSNSFDSGTEPSTTTSGGAGNWSFSNLLPGTYTVREVLTVGAATYECSAPSFNFDNCEFTHTLSSGQTATTDTFGNFRRASISGLKFEDSNGNGTQDAGEQPIQDVRIYLDGSGSTAANDSFDADETSTSTAADGTYSFTDLKPGNYSVREEPPTGFSCTTPGGGNFADCEYNFTPLTSGTNSTGNNFGNAQPGSISGTKFADTDGNGLQEGAEGPLSGVTIYLDADNSDTFDAGEPSDTTDVDGNWTLTGIAPGSRTVREVPPPGSVCTAPSATFTNCEFTHNVTSGGSIVGDKFGNAPAPIVSGTKFGDTNANGSKDAGELGIQGVRIYDDANDNNAFDTGEASVLTDSNGDWSLIVTPGNHTIREVPPAGFECSTPGTIGDASTCEFSIVGIDYGQTDGGHDFGNFQRGSISGIKFQDNNGDGSKQGPEPFIQGVTIYLDGSNGQPLNDSFDVGETSTTTNASGAWSFTNLVPGDYSVREVPPSGFVCTAPSKTDANCEFNISLASGQASTGHAFGNAQPATISGKKFEDLDADSTEDAGEPGIQGVTIYLDADNSGTLDAGETSTTTDVNGAWSFTVPPGSYTVREVLQPGYQCSVPSTNFNNCKFTHTVTSGQTVTGDDFGNFRLASIAGTKFEDLDGSGSKDTGEPGIPGVTIYIDENGDNAKANNEPSTTTDANGDYSFTGLHPGNYSIREVLPTGYSCTMPSSTFANCEYNFTPLTSGTDSTGNDFGNARPGTISGTKFEDTDADGTKDTGEPPLSGVTIYLDANNNDSFDSGTETSTTTAADGTYSFTLAPSPTSYTVREVPPTGYECSTPGTIGDASSCEYSVAVTSNGSFTGKDFGNFRRASIAGMKFEDTNGNGSKDTGEPPIPNVTIYLDANGNDTLDSGTETTTAQTTDALGNYSFTNLVPGNYSVREDLPTGYQCSAPSTTFANCEYNLTPLTSGTDSTGNDFGNYRPATVSGTKFNDQNFNSAKDAGEPPIQGVTIYLDANGNNVMDAGSETTGAQTTDINGNWSFINLIPGSYTEREVEPTGYLCSAPSTNFSQCEFSQTLTSGTNDSTGQDFGNVQSATFSGTKFDDANGNGVNDGEGPLSGVQIYLDGTGGQLADDIYESGEATTTSDGAGAWSIGGLYPGTFTAREVEPSGYQCTAPSTTFANCEFTETLTPGQNSSAGHDFGNYLIPAPPGGGGGGGGGGGTGGGGTGGGTTGGTGGTITGTASSDQLTGTPGNDVIMGGAGNDVINCGGGRDTVFAGGGKDVVNCGGGNDIVYAGPGNDLLRGQAGNDTLKGQGGKDKLLGAAGNDTLVGGPGTDVLKPGSGKNKIKQ